MAANSTYRLELRRKYPVLGKLADYYGNRVTAIRLFCLECQGGSTTGVKTCGMQTCFVWPFRLGGTIQDRRSTSEIPTREEYDELQQTNVNANEKTGNE